MVPNINTSSTYQIIFKFSSLNFPIKIFKPDWLKYGKAAGPIRNQQIIEYATHVIAFPSKTGKGTQDSIIRAKKLNRKLIICPID